MNIGTGFKHQDNAMWQLQNGDTTFSDLTLWATDFFINKPLNKENGTAFTGYLAYLNYDFGANYIRNIGVNNTADGVDPSRASFNGRGNSFPVIGTGNVINLQLGYALPKFKNSGSQLQPYFYLEYADYDRLDDNMVLWDLGLMWLLHGHYSKFGLNVQNRPIFFERDDKLLSDGRKNMVVLMYQFRID